MGLLRDLRGDTPLEDRRRRFVRTAGFVLVFFAVGFVFGAAQVWRALHSGQVWVNYRGAIITQSEMHDDLVFLIVGAVLSALLAWFWLRYWRRRL